MKKLLIAIVSIGALSAIVGCSTTPPPPPPPPSTPTVFQVRTLVVNVSPQQGTRSEFATSLGRKLGNECEMRGFAKPEGTPDATVTINVGRKEKGHFGNFLVYGGTADVRVTTNDNRTLAIKSFETERKQHAVGEENAERPVVDELSEKIAAWLENVLPRATTSGSQPVNDIK